VNRRLVTVDRARGLAILLMFLDHLLVLIQFRSPERLDVVHGLRMTVTRASLPLFCMCTGVLLHRRSVRSTRRVWMVAAVAVPVNVALEVVPMGIRAPEILAVWSLVMLTCTWGIVAYPALSAILGVLQVVLWPYGWHGYEPGLLVAFIAIGHLASLPSLEWAQRLPSWMGALGSRPLTWYVSHLAVLLSVQVIWP